MKGFFGQGPGVPYVFITIPEQWVDVYLIIFE
jgi:hypothetical protein